MITKDSDLLNNQKGEKDSDQIINQSYQKIQLDKIFINGKRFIITK